MMRWLAFLLAITVCASPAWAQVLPRRSVLGAAVTAAETGLRVTVVVPGSAAARAGLKVDDVIVSVASTPVNDTAAFVAMAKRLPTDRPTAFAIRRAGVASTLRVVGVQVQDEHDPEVQTLYQAVSVDGLWRRTLLTLPLAARGRLPAVLILGGIGCYSVDAAANPDDAYMRLSHDLSRRGFVVMRLEKSGVGDSRGPACLTVDFQSEIRSYAAALTALRADPHVDAARVYLFGHSIGSLIAPQIAEHQPVAGVVMAEGVGRDWYEYELLNLRRQLELGGEAPEQVDAALVGKEDCMHRLLIERQAEADIERARPDCKIHNAYPAADAYMQQVAAVEIAHAWSILDVPLLAIYGTGDFITTEKDHRRIVGIVNAAHPGAASLQIVPGMDHQLEAVGTPAEAYDLRVRRHLTGHYASGLSAAVSDWLCAREVCRGRS